MKHRSSALLAAMALVVAACTSSGDDPGETAAPAPETTTTTTPTVTADELCTALKVATFDLESELGDVFSIEDLGEDATLDDLDEEAVGEQFATVILEFYATIGALAETAPDDIRADFQTVTGEIEPLREQLESMTPGSSAEGLDDLDPEALSSSELTEAAERIEAWSLLNCGTEISVAPETLIVETVLAAVVAGMGDLLGGLGEALEDLEGLGDLGDLGDLEGLGDAFGDTFDAVTYGDNADLDALWDRCATDDYAACDELSFNSFNAYQLFGATCGGSLAFRAFSTECDEKFNGTAVAYGDDPYLDSVYDSCADGDTFSCDLLSGSAPIDSAYEAFGATCGDTRDAAGVPCEFAESGEPFTYGDDATLDALWDGCSTGDATACSDLYFDTAFDSAYEAFGDVCGLLVDRGDDCALVAELLGGPVG